MVAFGNTILHYNVKVQLCEYISAVPILRSFPHSLFPQYDLQRAACSVFGEDKTVRRVTTEMMEKLLE